MKQILLIVAIFFSLPLLAQHKPASNFPVLANAYLTNENGGEDATKLVKDKPVRFCVTVINTSPTEAIKAGTCYLLINLGKSLKLPQPHAYIRFPLSKYIKWSELKDENGNLTLTGQVTGDLPADFIEEAVFNLICVEAGDAEVKAEWVAAKDRGGNGSPTVLGYTVLKKRTKD